MASIFTRIIQGEIPCQKLAEDERFFAFLDIRPINPGHTLVVPKREVDILWDLEEEELAGLMVFAKRLEKSIRQAVPCLRIGVMVAGLEVPHAHMHLIPMHDSGDLDFGLARPASSDELAKVGDAIRLALQKG